MSNPVEHDDECESEFYGAGAGHTPCKCDERRPPRAVGDADDGTVWTIVDGEIETRSPADAVRENLAALTEFLAGREATVAELRVLAEKWERVADELHNDPTFVPREGNRLDAVTWEILAAILGRPLRSLVPQGDEVAR